MYMKIMKTTLIIVLMSPLVSNAWWGTEWNDPGYYEPTPFVYPQTGQNRFGRIPGDDWYPGPWPTPPKPIGPKPKPKLPGFGAPYVPFYDYDAMQQLRNLRSYGY